MEICNIFKNILHFYLILALIDEDLTYIEVKVLANIRLCKIFSVLMADKRNTLSRNLLEFNSLLTGDARSAILAGDPTTSRDVS